MAKTDNLTDFLKDVADAIREKKGTTDLINPQDFSAEIVSIQSGGGSKWTGHADAEGLRAIGWTDEDIAYYQENGVNWNEEDDDYHKVTDDNKALYGVLTASNISTYKDSIVYLPKIDTSSITSLNSKFSGCVNLVGIPRLDTSGVTNMSYAFNNCQVLVSVPPLDTSKVTAMNHMFYGCRVLVGIPQLDTSKVTTMSNMFYGCYSLVSLPQLDTSNVTNINSAFNNCYSLVSIPQFNAIKVTKVSNSFYGCCSLARVTMQYVKNNIPLTTSALLSKNSLLYLINNEAATSAITISLAAYAYTRLAEDADIVAALANHPNITIAK